MSLTLARRVADSVLYEGYLLYPYRSSSAKNQVRWQFGFLGPVGAPSQVSEEPVMQAEVLLRHEGQPRLTLFVRFLQVLDRSVLRLTAEGLEPVSSLGVGETRWTNGQEATEREIAIEGITLAGLTRDLTVPALDNTEDLYDGDQLVGRLHRTAHELLGNLSVSSRRTDRGTVVRVRVANVASWSGVTQRDEVAKDAFVGTHLLMEVEGGTFVSLVETPDHGCINERCWPVLVRDDDGGDAVLVAPIILPEHPELAPESAGDLFDATEIDEILTLRILTLTDDERQAVRGTDPRAAALLARSDALRPDDLARLHGTVRESPWWTPEADAAFSPETDSVLVDGRVISRGSRVRLRPRKGGDAQDMFVDGLDATVTGVLSDVDGGWHVAVTIDDDPASELHEWYGRFSYFRPDEVEPI